MSAQAGYSSTHITYTLYSHFCSFIPVVFGQILEGNLSCDLFHVAFTQEKRRLAIRNAAQQWEGVRACLELPPTNGAKEEFSPENSPGHSPAQSNGVTQESSPDEPKYMFFNTVDFKRKMNVLHFRIFSKDLLI